MIQQYSSNYNSEVETEKPFKRKRKGNDLDGKVLCVFWWDRHCRVAHRQNRVVRRFAHAHIAILANSYSDEAVAMEIKKIEKSLSDISNFLRWNSLRFGREVIPYQRSLLRWPIGAKHNSISVLKHNNLLKNTTIFWGHNNLFQCTTIFLRTRQTFQELNNLFQNMRRFPDTKQFLPKHNKIFWYTTAN